MGQRAENQGEDRASKMLPDKKCPVKMPGNVFNYKGLAKFLFTSANTYTKEHRWDYTGKLCALNKKTADFKENQVKTMVNWPVPNQILQGDCSMDDVTMYISLKIGVKYPGFWSLWINQARKGRYYTITKIRWATQGLLRMYCGFSQPFSINRNRKQSHLFIRRTDKLGQNWTFNMGWRTRVPWKLYKNSIWTWCLEFRRTCMLL